jgi:hypothetical protein
VIYVVTEHMDFETQHTCGVFSSPVKVRDYFRTRNTGEITTFKGGDMRAETKGSWPVILFAQPFKGIDIPEE